MKLFPVHRAALAAAIVLLAVPAVVRAQEKQPPETKPKSQAAPKQEAFFFQGGGPRDFIRAVNAHYQVDWMGIVTIPREFERVQVPRIRVATPKPGDLLKLYNRLGEQNRILGKWYLEGDETAPSVLMLVADGGAANAPTPADPRALEVVPLRDIPDSMYPELLNAISRALDNAVQLKKEDPEAFATARTVLDQRTNSLIVSGTREALELVKGIISAFEYKHGAHTRPAPEAAPALAPAAKK